MARPRGEVGARRRRQIIEAAVAIIAEHGIQALSLSAIETRAKPRMSRGQLTYYFRTKEDILLAVFDHMMDEMRRRAAAGDGPPGCELHDLAGWPRVKAFLAFMVLQPPEVPDFHALQYTFLSQVGYRDDFRQRLAGLYEQWRSGMAGDLNGDMVDAHPAVSPRTVATFIQALLHGLSMQRVADAGSYDRGEMLALCLGLLEPYLGQDRAAGAGRNNEEKPAAKRKRAGAAAPSLPPSATPTTPTPTAPRRRRGARLSTHGSDRNGQP